MTNYCCLLPHRIIRHTKTRRRCLADDRFEFMNYRQSNIQELPQIRKIDFFKSQKLKKGRSVTFLTHLLPLIFKYLQTKIISLLFCSVVPQLSSPIHSKEQTNNRHDDCDSQYNRHVPIHQMSEEAPDLGLTGSRHSILL